MASVEAHSAKTVTCKPLKAIIFYLLIDSSNLGQRPRYLINYLILGTWGGGCDHMASIEADGAETVTCKLPKTMVFD
jgi:hypothetical protein